MKSQEDTKIWVLTVLRRESPTEIAFGSAISFTIVLKGFYSPHHEVYSGMQAAAL
jgi:hypothetical protein